MINRRLVSGYSNAEYETPKQCSFSWFVRGKWANNLLDMMKRTNYVAKLTEKLALIYSYFAE